MKKVLAMILALIMVVGCLSGCGEKITPTDAPKETDAPKMTDAPKATEGSAQETQPEEKEWFGTEDGKTITLRFWGGVQPEYGYDEVVATFNEQYKDKGVRAEYIRYVNDTQGNLQLETYLMGGGEIDVFMGYGGRTKLDNRVDSGLVLDMSDMLKAEGFDLVEELGDANMSTYHYEDGSVYGFPTKYENGKWLLINVDMFKAAGVEIPYDGWTYSEFLTAIEKLTTGEGQDKVYGVSWNQKQYRGGIKSMLGSVLDEYSTFANVEGSEVNYAHPVWKAGLEMVKTSLDNGWAIPIEDEISEGMSVANTFLAGKCAISACISQMRLVMDTATYGHEFTTALVPGPVPDDAEYQTEYYRTHANTTGAGDLLCIAANTEYPEACFEFAMWYVQGGMSPLVKGGRIPLWTGLDKALVTEVLTENAGDAIDLESMTKYLSIDNTKGKNVIKGYANSEISDVWIEEFEAMCYGRQSVDETIAKMISRSNDLIKAAMDEAK